ncbi:metallophosphoesterase family protein [Flavihumibacter fluvii]|uniref:metallophosphoesterase family protein n=1 Tax=Flavihumibacter fluvii TaxID=2838157 RepID=UPI001BDF0C16|nr:metallophosphoesterase [Flavihumibacter fluvii]ULQ51175.1 metallophosphoesterase [Flavihumibacter fluvii]
MKRRDLLKYVSAGTLGLGLNVHAMAGQGAGKVYGGVKKGSFAIDGNRVRFFHPGIREKFSMLMLADTHLFKDDQRGEPYRQYSGRMAKAYNQTKHFQTGEATDPETSFITTLNIAAEQNAAFVALVGDIFSFPSEAAVDWVQAQLKSAGLPYEYTAGNHDWHYEGMEGSSTNLRRTWIENRLKPMYRSADPMMSYYEVNDTCFITIDNSTYEILPEQLDFYNKKIRNGKPTILMVHIPLFAPGRSVGFGCGNPDWGAKTDKNFELERRQRWPEKGHTKTTFDFYKAVFNSENLMGILAGHIHKPSLDVINGIPQIVTDANAVGAYLQVELIPAEKTQI